MSQQNKVAVDLNRAINAFTKSLMWKISEGHPVEQEEIDALNEMRIEAGMKPLNISAQSQPNAQSEPAGKKAPRPQSAPKSEGKGTDSAGREQDFNPQAITINGRTFEGEMLPDGKLWEHRFHIKSESSGRLYTIAQNKNNRYWGCDCPGWIGHRKCKHLKALELPFYEKPYEATLKSASTKTGAIKIADDEYSSVLHVLAAELIHSDAELSQMMEPAFPAEVQGEVHIEGPEAGNSNDELHENAVDLNGGSPTFDGDIKHPERQNVNAIREALETQVEMEVGKPIEQKQEEVAVQEKVQDAALAQGAGGLAGDAGVQEVSAKPGTQIVINVASWDYPAKKAALLNKTASISREELKKTGQEFLSHVRTAAIQVAQGEDADGFHMLVNLNGREYVLRGTDADEFRREYAAIPKPENKVNALVEKWMWKLQPYGQKQKPAPAPSTPAKAKKPWGIPEWLRKKEQ